MPGLKISELPFASTPSLDDLIVLVHAGETVHTTFRQLEQLFTVATSPPIQHEIGVGEAWTSPSLGIPVQGFSRKYIVTLNTSSATMSFEALLTINGSEPVYSYYGFIGARINAEVEFAVVGGNLVTNVINNEPVPLTIVIRPLT